MRIAQIRRKEIAGLNARQAVRLSSRILSLVPMKTPVPKSIFLIGMGLLVPMLAARAARSVAGKGYKAIRGEDAPRNPADPDVEWREALIWAAVSGIVGGVARMSSRRLLGETVIPARGDDMDDELDDLA